MSKSNIKDNNSNDRNNMWGGRFQQSPAQIMQNINASIGFDKRLFEQDIRASKAHCDMLIKQQIITVSDGRAILSGLDQILQEYYDGKFNFSAELEDIHMNIEHRLSQIIGDAAGRLHTARSRNDQVATDLRLWVRDHIDIIIDNLTKLQISLINRAKENIDTIMPGYTHLQAAQPVSFAHHLLAYQQMFARDTNRFQDTRKRVNQSPLGSAALAGTGFDIDRFYTADLLEFDCPMANSMDGVSARDFAMEHVSACAIFATHLSRLCEDMILWSSQQFQFVTLSDAFTTGSSIMPQKRNSDGAELIKGKTGRVVGDLVSLLSVMKGLPMTYGKDMQEDKEPVFDATDTVILCCQVMQGMIDDMVVHDDKMYNALKDGFITATDLADWLVRCLNMPFRQAHHVTGALVALAEQNKCDLCDLTLEQMQSVEPNINNNIYDILSPKSALNNRQSFGGTSPKSVGEAIKNARIALKI